MPSLQKLQGSVITDMNRPRSRKVQKPPSIATLPADGYTGHFIHLGQEFPW